MSDAYIRELRREAHADPDNAQVVAALVAALKRAELPYLCEVHHLFHLGEAGCHQIVKPLREGLEAAGFEFNVNNESSPHIIKTPIRISSNNPLLENIDMRPWPVDSLGFELWLATPALPAAYHFGYEEIEHPQRIELQIGNTDPDVPWETIDHRDPGDIDYQEWLSQFSPVTPGIINYVQCNWTQIPFRDTSPVFIDLIGQNRKINLYSIDFTINVPTSQYPVKITFYLFKGICTIALIPYRYLPPQVAELFEGLVSDCGMIHVETHDEFMGFLSDPQL